MPTKTRLSSEARRQAIIAVAQRLFAEKGFHGTTTRELARVAGVSEALLFKHFPTKEAMYDEMLAVCRKSQTGEEFRRVLDLEASTSTLVLMLHFLASKVLFAEEDGRNLHRLLARSLCEDGAFARIVLGHIGSTWVTKLYACMAAARKAGDLRASSAPLKAGPWLAEHLLMMLAFMGLPERAVAHRKVTDAELIEEAVVFCLRGMGVKDEAIKRFYNPRAFALLAPTLGVRIAPARQATQRVGGRGE
jgi:AcrR family transcriptional regulator